MKYKYGIIGAGMQGTAAGYWLAKQEDTLSVEFYDIDEAKSETAAKRINNLLNGTKCKKQTSSNDMWENVNAVLGCANYWYNEKFSECATLYKTHFNDLGGNTDIVKKQLGFHHQAMDAGISIVPDCGLAPGMANTLAKWCMDKMINGASHVEIRVGGLPQNKNCNFLGYKKLFNLHGLTNEYSGQATAIKNGEIVHINTLSHMEPVQVQNLNLFADVTSGGTSTCCESFLKNDLDTYNYKTLRWSPMHWYHMRGYKEIGLFKNRELFHPMLDKIIDMPDEKDMTVMSIKCWADECEPYICEQHCNISLIDKHDDETGFSSMERTTGFSAAIVTAMQARGQVKPGAVPLELSVNSEIFMKEATKEFDFKVESNVL